MSTTPLKLPDELEQRVVHAAQEMGISPHAFMIDAIAQATDAVRRRAEFIAQGQSARAEMLQSGNGYAANEVHPYLRQQLSNNHAERPEPLDQKQWNEKHASFIAAYNTLVEAEGVALQEWRAF